MTVQPLTLSADSVFHSIHFGSLGWYIRHDLQRESRLGLLIQSSDV